MAGFRGLGETEWHIYHNNFNRQRSGPEIDSLLREQKTPKKVLDEMGEEKQSTVQKAAPESILPENN